MMNPQVMEPVRCITLQIIVKSHMFGDFCYLGYDQHHERVFRPMLKDPIEMEIGGVYSFMYRDSEQNDFIFPHATNDLLAETAEELHPSLPWQSLWSLTIDSLFPFASPSFFDGMLQHSAIIKDFYGNMKEVVKYYVEEGTICHSVGILLPHYINIYENSKGKYRIEMDLESYGAQDFEQDFWGNVIRPSTPTLLSYDFPYTATETPHHTMLKSPDYDQLVVLSMSRPFAGQGPELFCPRRCYVLAVGILVRRKPEEDFWY